MTSLAFKVFMFVILPIIDILLRTCSFVNVNDWLSNNFWKCIIITNFHLKTTKIYLKKIDILTINIDIIKPSKFHNVNIWHRKGEKNSWPHSNPIKKSIFSF